MVPPATLSPPENLAELLERLGQVPPERIRMQPPPGTATEADVLAALEAPRKRLCELIDGVLVEKAMGYTESVLASVPDRAPGRVRASAQPGSGDVAGRDSPTLGRPRAASQTWPSFPGSVCPDRQRPREPIPTLAPDLAIEILSRSNTRKEMRRKREDYFAPGFAWCGRSIPRRGRSTFTPSRGLRPPY